MLLFDVLAACSEEVFDCEDETFALFTSYNGSNDLGMVSRDATSVDLSIAGRDFCILQSPGLLTSSRSGGTTGAVLWKVTPLFAAWLSDSSNFIWKNRLLGADSCILELGAGISGIVGLAVGPKVGRYIYTDQAYVLKLLASNLEENQGKEKPREGRGKSQKRKKQETERMLGSKMKLEILELDWETSDLRRPSLLLGKVAPDENANPIDLLVAVDCVFNESIIEPFVKTLVALSNKDLGNPVMSVVAQQLRSPDVFSSWLETTLRYFRVWRLTEDELKLGMVETIDKKLTVSNGYVVHICLLR